MTPRFNDRGGHPLSKSYRDLLIPAFIIDSQNPSDRAPDDFPDRVLWEWVEAYIDDYGNALPHPHGRWGTFQTAPAFEANNLNGRPGSLVWLRLAADRDVPAYEFNAGNPYHVTLPAPDPPPDLYLSGSGGGGPGSGSPPTPPGGCDVLYDGTGRFCFGPHVTVDFEGGVEFSRLFGLGVLTRVCPLFGELREGDGVTITPVEGEEGAYVISSAGGGGGDFLTEAEADALYGRLAAPNVWTMGNRFGGAALGVGDGITNHLFLLAAGLGGADRVLTLNVGANRTLTVAADASVSGTNTGDQTNVTGSAGTLSPGRQINGVLFDGSANITVTAAAGTLTGATLASGVTASSLQTFGTVTQIELGHATDTTLTRSSAGNLAVEGNVVYRAAGADVAVADGGTGVSSLTAYAVVCGGTTSTGAVQSVASVGAAGQVLTSAGAGALPTFSDVVTGTTQSVSGGHTISSGVGTFEDATLLTLTLTPGTYAVWMSLRGQVNISAGTSPPFIVAKLNYNGSDVSDSETLVVYHYAATTGVAVIGSCSSGPHFVTVNSGDASKVVKVRVKKDGSGDTFTGASLASDANGRSKLIVVRIA